MCVDPSCMAKGLWGDLTLTTREVRQRSGVLLNLELMDFLKLERADKYMNRWTLPNTLSPCFVVDNNVLSEISYSTISFGGVPSGGVLP